MTNLGRRAVLVVVALLSVACGSGSTTPAERVVSLETTACGHASRTSGAGVIVEDGWVLASAHVVAGANEVKVHGEFGSQSAEIVVLDTSADLALLRVEHANASPVDVAAVDAGDVVRLAGGGPSGAFSANIIRRVEVRIEAVRSVERISRFGYEIDERVLLGDSGGGVYDANENLVGVVFGRTLDDERRSFIVNNEEIARVLAAERRGLWSCDASEHQVTRTAE